LAIDWNQVSSIFLGVITALATVALAYYAKRSFKGVKDQMDLIFKQSIDMKRQADAMEIQSKIMLENIEYNRLSKQHERLSTEMALLVGPLNARRKETKIFRMVDRSERYSHHAKEVLNAMHHDYITFWETIDKNLYLNQSSELRRALDNYYQAIYHNFYFLELNMQSEAKTNEDIFQNHTVPFLIKKIEERYNQLDKEIEAIEDRLNIRTKI
jgi:hypothetical protein